MSKYSGIVDSINKGINTVGTALVDAATGNDIRKERTRGWEKGRQVYGRPHSAKEYKRLYQEHDKRKEVQSMHQKPGRSTWQKLTD